MAKNVNFKNSEPMEVQIKRAILNGMTFTDCEKCFSQKRSFIIDINNRISIEDRKALTGKGLADCVSQETQHQIAELLRKGKTTKAISQQTRLPAKVINAISEARIANVFEDLKQVKEKPVYQELTDITNNIPTADDIPEIDVEETGITVSEAKHETITEAETKKKTKGRKEKVSDEMGELLFHEYETGKTYKDIAKEYGISLNRCAYAVSKYCKNHNISLNKTTCHTTKPQKKTKNAGYILSKDTVEYISKLLIAGFGNKEIFIETGVNPQVISNIRHKRSYCNYTKGLEFPTNEMNKPTFHKGTMSKETFDGIISQIFERRTDKEIAETFNVAANTVNSIRNHKKFRKMTEGMEFPKPIDSTYRVDYARGTSDFSDSEAPNDTMSGSMTRLTPDQELEAEETHEEEEFEEEEEEYDCIGSKRYFMNITKAFAANAAAAVLIKDGTLITYAVDEVIENAITRIIAMATVEEIKGSSLYLYGGEVSYEYLTNMIVCLGINEINLPKKDENN